jgi:hypothetical protein
MLHAPLMKKLFPLHHPRKADGRVLDAIKHEVRKYVRRELNKVQPEGTRRRIFSCRVGASQASAQETALKDISAAIDRVAQAGAADVFIAIKSTPVDDSQPS